MLLVLRGQKHFELTLRTEKLPEFDGFQLTDTSHLGLIKGVSMRANTDKATEGIPTVAATTDAWDSCTLINI